MYPIPNIIVIGIQELVGTDWLLDKIITTLGTELTIIIIEIDNGVMKVHNNGHLPQETIGGIRLATYILIGEITTVILPQEIPPLTIHFKTCWTANKKSNKI